MDDNRNMLEEEWRPVSGYEGFYEVSNRGSVRSLDRIVIRKDGRSYLKKGRVLKPTASGKGPYYMVSLCNDDSESVKSVHRLVATAFIPNPENLPVINHKDENKLNNCADNLEWCTQQYNLNYGSAREKISVGYIHPIVAVEQRDIKDNFIAEYKSIGEASRKTGINSSHICECCKKINKSAGGYKWNYKQNND